MVDNVEHNRETRIKFSDESEHVISYDQFKNQLVENNVLGNGTFGTVWKITHKNSNTPLAIKMINEGEKNNSGNNEIKINLLLNSRSCSFITKFYGYILAEGSIWIISELMDTCLYKFYKRAFEFRKHIDELFISKVAFSVLNAIQYMREFRTMHRDIKPSNILINRSGQIKICDFGISGFTVNSVCRSHKGCEIYMPPEKITSCSNNYTHKSDIWSLGISLIEISTGVHPFSDDRDYLCIIKNVIYNASPKLDREKFSIEFCEFIDKCLIKDPNNRPSCEHLLNEPFITVNLNRNIDNDFILDIINLIK